MNINCVVYSLFLYVTLNGMLIVIPFASDLSHRHKESPSALEQPKPNDKSRGKQSEELASPDHEHFPLNEETGTKSQRLHDDKEEESEIAYLETTRSIPSPPPLPNTSARPDIVIHDKSGSQASRRSLPPPPRAVPESLELDTQPEPQVCVAPPRPSRRSIPPPPVPMDEGM